MEETGLQETDFKMATSFRTLVLWLGDSKKLSRIRFKETQKRLELKCENLHVAKGIFRTMPRSKFLLKSVMS